MNQTHYFLFSLPAFVLGCVLWLPQAFAGNKVWSQFKSCVSNTEASDEEWRQTEAEYEDDYGRLSAYERHRQGVGRRFVERMKRRTRELARRRCGHIPLLKRPSYSHSFQDFDGRISLKANCLREDKSWPLTQLILGADYSDCLSAAMSFSSNKSFEDHLIFHLFHKLNAFPPLFYTMNGVISLHDKLIEYEEIPLFYDGYHLPAGPHSDDNNKYGHFLIKAGKPGRQNFLSNGIGVETCFKLPILPALQEEAAYFYVNDYPFVIGEITREPAEKSWWGSSCP